MSKLVLIDGNAILHRAYHAMPPLTTKKGEPIGAVYGLVSMLLRIITDLKPTHLAVCFDAKGPNFRNKIYKDYQAQRPETDNELISQFEKARITVTAMAIPYYEKTGFEADDLIGTICAKTTDYGQQNTKRSKVAIDSSRSAISEVVIITGDRDILQLVNDRVKVFLPVKGLSEGKIFGAAEVKEKLGVEPPRIVDYKALVGDQSDNYPGVAGIGPKTAEKLLERYKTLSEVYDHLDEIEGATREKLIKNKKDAFMSYELAMIIKDVEINYEFEKMNKWDVGSKDVIALFEDYGFKTLTNRVKMKAKQINDEKQGILF